MSFSKSTILGGPEWQNYVTQGEAAASGRQAAEGATEFDQNDLYNLLLNFD